MGVRSTVYNSGIVTNELWNTVLKENKELMEEFLSYKASNRADSTVDQYRHQLKIFLVWNLQNNNNKFYIDVKKRDLIKYFRYLQDALKSSPNRIAGMRAVLSSWSNYIEAMWDEEYPNFKNVVRVIEVSEKQNVRAKTILTEKQVQDCLDALIRAKKYQVACYFALAVSCGARKAELVRFKVDYFKPENIICQGSLYETPEEIKTKGRGKLGKMLKKYTLREMFQPYFEWWMQEREQKGIDCKYLFVAKASEGYKAATVDNANYFAEIIEQYMGIPFYNHAARHYWATQMKRKGLPDDVIMVLQGWATAEIMKKYIDLDSKESFQKYFDAGGIKKVEDTRLEDL